jgi:hypothetical protein
MSSTKIIIASQACSINQYKNLKSHIHSHRFIVPIFVTNWIKQLNCMKYLPFQNGYYLGIYKLWSTSMWIRHPPKLIKHGTEAKYFYMYHPYFNVYDPSHKNLGLTPRAITCDYRIYTYISITKYYPT